MIHQISVQTKSKTEVINITQQLSKSIEDIRDGLAVIYAPHTTVVLIVCEDDEELRRDLIKVIENLLAELRPFEHIRKNNPNAEAHIISALGGTSLTIPVVNGKLDLGTHQNIILIEMDGPKTRKIRCKVHSCYST
jgi:secondary thiamine-phosphate synthase enzyme